MSEIVPAEGKVLSQGELVMTVNGQPRQKADLSQLIWSISEIFTGTPEGVGPVVAGDPIEGRVQGAGEIRLKIGPAE